MEEIQNNTPADQKPTDKKNLEDAEELKSKLALAEKERDEYLNGWKRAKADLANARREWEQKMADLADWVKADFIIKLLPVVDALEAGDESEDLKPIRKLFWETLHKNGLEEMSSLGKEFNPAYHESVEIVDGDEGRVVEVLQKGYLFKGEVLRPARVKIGKRDANIQMHANETNI